MYAVYTDCTQLGIDAGIRKRPTAPSTNTLQLEKAASNLKSLPNSDSAPSSRDSPWFAQASPEHLRSWRISQICNMLDFRRVPVCSRGAQLRISVGGTRNDSDTRDDSDDSLNRDRSAQLGPFGSLRQPPAASCTIHPTARGCRASNTDLCIFCRKALSSNPRSIRCSPRQARSAAQADQSPQCLNQPRRARVSTPRR